MWTLVLYWIIQVLQALLGEKDDVAIWGWGVNDLFQE